MRRAGYAVAAVAGAVAGAGLMLAVPVPGMPDRPGSRRPSEPAIRGTAPVPTVLAWTSGGLPDGFAGAVRRLPTVERVAVVRSGIAWLDAWRDRTGANRSPRSGLRIPTEIAAVVPPSYEEFVPEADAAAIAGLQEGGALLGSAAATLRHLDSGGTLRFDRVSLQVEGVIDDELIGAHEVVVSAATGRALGITRARYLLVDPRDGVGPERLEAGLRRAVPGSIRLRVRAPGETPVFRHGDAVLAQVRLKEIFGEFAAVPGADGSLRPDPAWVRANIRDVRVPILGRVACHRTLIPQLRGALAELVRRGLGDLVNAGDYGGCYSPRFANFDPGAGLSHHSWGAAIDFNVTENPLGSEPRMDRRVVEVFERWGFQWGGRFLVPDGMHFEFLRFPPES